MKLYFLQDCIFIIQLYTKHICTGSLLVSIKYSWQWQDYRGGFFFFFTVTSNHKKHGEGHRFSTIQKYQHTGTKLVPVIQREHFSQKFCRRFSFVIVWRCHFRSPSVQSHNLNKKNKYDFLYVA